VNNGDDMGNIDLPQIGQRIKELRVACGLSQQELAQQAGLSVSVVFQMEQGKRNDPKLSTVVALAGPLGKKPGQLVEELMQASGAIAAIRGRPPKEATGKTKRK
jgi:transcriptional regulator with XRE-family HTH domain